MAGERDVLAEAISDATHGEHESAWIDYEEAVAALAARGWRLVPSPEPLPLDVERLTAALLNAQDGQVDHSAACLKTTCPVASELRDFAPILAREYAALSEPREPAT